MAKITTKTIRDEATEEFTVQLFIDGVRQPLCDYFTDDPEDAKQTAAAMIIDATKKLKS